MKLLATEPPTCQGTPSASKASTTGIRACQSSGLSIIEAKFDTPGDDSFCGFDVSIQLAQKDLVELWRARLGMGAADRFAGGRPAEVAQLDHPLELKGGAAGADSVEPDLFDFERRIGRERFH